MGVYYFFFNKTKGGVQNQHVLSGNICDFVSHFNKFSYEAKIELFELCIKLNNWDPNDIIIAVPDYDYEDLFSYENGVIYIDNDEKSNYFE